MPQELDRFPDDVMIALHEANVTVSCIPVQIDHGDWLAALFFVLPADAPCLHAGKLSGAPFSVAFDADLHEHEKGTLIELGVEIGTPIEVSRGTVMFLTGHSGAHFRVLKMLTDQEDLPLFIGNEFCQVLAQQRVPLNNALRQGLRSLLDEAVAKDAVIRMSGHYDPDAVFADVLGHTGLS